MHLGKKEETPTTKLGLIVYNRCCKYKKKLTKAHLITEKYLSPIPDQPV